MSEIAENAPKKEFIEDYDAIMKDFKASPFNPAPHEWIGKGDAFVKFSLYQDAKTIALPHTLS